MRTIIYGSRPDGQAKVVAELAATNSELELVGLVDDFAENRTRTIGELAVIGTGDQLSELRGRGVEALLIGFGESRGRSAIVERATSAGFDLPNLVHQSSVRYASATLGRAVQVFPLAHVGAGARLADGVLVNTGASIEHDCVLETGSVVLPGAKLGGRVRVGRDATIGAGAIVLPDVSIGAGAFVGAGAVVLRDVAEEAVVAGVPARRLRGGGSGP